jgi:hypothetical protein
MKCLKCECNVRSKKTKVDYSKESFSGVEIVCKLYTCKCGFSLTEFPDDHEINKEICNFILNQGQIKREQLRYLTKNVFGESLFEFAKRCKTNPQHLKNLMSQKAIMNQELSDKIAHEMLKHFNKVTVSFR